MRREKIIKAASARGEGKIRGGTEKERIAVEQTRGQRQTGRNDLPGRVR